MKSKLLNCSLANVSTLAELLSSNGEYLLEEKNYILCTIYASIDVSSTECPAIEQLASNPIMLSHYYSEFLYSQNFILISFITFSLNPCFIIFQK